jgi:hypothetical protein
MKINSLEKMETIVENNADLHWNGWDVVEIRKAPTGWMKPDGVYMHGEWHTQRYYIINEDGWNIPSKFVRDDEE